MSYEKLPTLPTDVTAPLVEPVPAADPIAQWVHVVPPPRPKEGLGGIALALAILALVASLFMGWAAPVALVAVVVAAIAIRRPMESRTVGVWALVLGLVALVYSAGWLLWTASQLGMLG